MSHTLEAISSILSLISHPCWIYDAELNTTIYGNSLATALFRQGLASFQSFTNQVCASGNDACDDTPLLKDSVKWAELRQKVHKDVQIDRGELSLTVMTNDRPLPPGFPCALPLGGPYRIQYKCLSLIGTDGKERSMALVQMELQPDALMMEIAQPTQPSLGHLQSSKQPPSTSKDDARRMVEMCMHHPMFQFLFDVSGQLMAANKMGMLNIIERLGTEKADHTLQRYISIGEAEGSLCQDEMYHAAMKAIFTEDLPCHRFAQLRASARTPGKFRWVLYEMWPLNDPVTRKRAVLVCEQNITQVKSLEEQFKRQNQRLEAQLEEALAQRDGTHRPTIDIDTPTDKTLKLLDKIMRGHEVSAREAMDLRDAIISVGGDLRQPVNFNQQVMHSDPSLLGQEVGASLIQLLSTNRKPLGDVIEGDHTLMDPSSGSRSSQDPHSHGSPHSLVCLQSAKSGHLWSSSQINIDGLQLDPPPLSMDSDLVVVPELVRLVKTPSEELMVKLGSIDQWQFDAFQLDKASNGRPLSALGFFLFKRFNLIDVFQLDENKLVQFLLLIEDGYPKNPYHNRIHAADVLQSLHVLLCRGQLVEKGFCDDLSLMSCYLSAIIHDYEHKGVNNDFLIKTSDPLAILYNDRSPMENHHLAAAFSQMSTREYNFLPRMPAKARDLMRRQVIEMVLATDMKQHFAIHSMFQAKTQPPSSSSSFPSAAAVSQAIRSRPVSNSGSQIHVSPLDSDQGVNSSGKGVCRDSQPSALSSNEALSRFIMDEDMKSLVLQVALKCADLGHLSSPPDVHNIWVSLLEEEFFRQGDEEKARALLISPLMDREKNGITKSQVGFFDIVALPLFQSFAQIFPSSTPMLDAVKDNYAMWRDVITSASKPQHP